MTRKWIGPALLDHVTVNGFSVGIDVANTEYGITLNHIYLNGQTTAGLRNSQNMISSNDLEVNSIGPAIINSVSDGEIVLASAQLTSQSTTTVQNTAGTIVFHGSTANNYQAFTGGPTTGNKLDGFLTGPTGWTSLTGSLYIPIADPPAVQIDPVTSWASVVAYGAVPVPWVNSSGQTVDDNGNIVTPTDSLNAFKAAFASGASTIYLPHGVYYVSSNIVIPDTVKRIVGMNSTIRIFSGNNSWKSSEGTLRLISTTSTTALQIESLTFNGSGQLSLEQGSTRPLVVLDGVYSTGAIMLNQTATGGAVFLSNVSSGGKNVLSGTGTVTAVQLNMEQCDVCMTNNGVDLNILGEKSEGDVTVVAATGGRTQVLGGLIYIVVTNPSPTKPAFTVNNAIMTASFVEEAYSDTTNYEYYLSETLSGTTTLTPDTQTGFIPRDPGSWGRVVPWLQTIKQ
jgi:hypothetical protein